MCLMRSKISCCKGGRSPEPDRRTVPAEPERAPDCVFPLITGTTGPVMLDLIADNARRLLDDAGADRDVHPG